MPKIIIAPPLTGCTTLGQMYHGLTSIILDVDAAMSDKTARPHKHPTLSERGLAIAKWTTEQSEAPIICVPFLPLGHSSAIDVVAIILIPPAQFIKRAETRAIGAGHKVAAVTWRDEAVRFTQAYPTIPVYTALQAVPVIQAALGVNGGFLVRSA